MFTVLCLISNNLQLHTMQFILITLSFIAAVNGKAENMKTEHTIATVSTDPKPSAENGFYFRRIPNLKWCKPLHWRKPPTKKVAALVTLPGSGSTWLRYLLQQATGIVTGSTDMDLSLLTHGFPGENVTAGSVLVVKTNYMPKQAWWSSAAVLLVRDLADSVLAEYNKRNAGHQNTAPVAAYKRGYHFNPNHDWKQFATKHITKWESLNTAWLQEYKKPLIVVRYEQLVRDTRAVLTRILKFLGQEITEKEMTCVMANREGLYRRYHRPLNFDPFTKAIRKLIKEAQDKVYPILTEYEKHNLTTAASNVEENIDSLSKTVQLHGNTYRIVDDWKGVMIS